MRADEKLAFAEIHLQELRDYAHRFSNDPWVNAHQESFFFHLAGAVEGLLQEVNDAYSLGLALRDVRWENTEKALERANQRSPAFDCLKALRDDKCSWAALLFEWRNHGTHRRRISKRINVSNTEALDNEFFDPRTGGVQAVFPGLGCQEVLEELHRRVRELVAGCRSRDGRLKEP